MWGEESTVTFTVRRVYERICESNILVTWSGLGKIWNRRVQQRVRSFIWILAHGKFLTNFNRWRRLMAENSKCAQWESKRKPTYMHCETVRKRKWCRLTSFPPELYGKFFDMNLQEWILWNLESLEMLSWSSGWKERFAITCWWICRWRNQVIFTGTRFEEDCKVERLNYSVMETT